VRTQNMEPISAQGSTDTRAATPSAEEQAKILVSFAGRLFHASQQPDYAGVPPPVWREWCSVVLDAIVQCRLGQLERRPTFEALRDWASRYFVVEEFQTRRRIQLALKAFRHATELI